MTSPVLETERLILRKPGPQDTDTVLEFFLSDRAKHVGGPYTLGGAWRQFAAEVGHWDLLGFGMWAVTRKGDDQILGLIGPWCPADWPENEIGWLVFGDAEGKGIAFEAARAALDHAFDTLGWTTAVSYIDHDNARSIALAERLGAVSDPGAPRPKPDHPCLVYRHPAPGERL
ncbi:MAG: GNAT family N-acetyltransferase [Pseudomonadota bacterium]